MTAWRRGAGLGVILLVAAAWGAEPSAPPLPRDTLPAKLFPAQPPLGLDPKLAAPDDNPLTEARVQLGRELFFEPLLSGDGKVACASCHDPAHGLASKDPQAIGIRGQRGRRNAPSLFNRAFATALFWDGRSATLEDQAVKPIADPLEMGSTVADAVARLQAHAEYSKKFAAAFPDGLNAANLARALAAFERTLLHGDSPVDRFIAAQTGHGLSESAKQGLWLFESRGQCWRCHAGRNYTDEQYHNTGVSWGKEPPDLGRYEITKREADRGRFKTPSLRGVALTPPYMHDGSVATLEEVVEFYSKGGGKNPNLDPAMQPLNFSKEEAQNLVDFLKALSEMPAAK
jgi:cytochrome c peroxidase